LVTDRPVTFYRNTLSNNKPLVARFKQSLLSLGFLALTPSFTFPSAEDVVMTVAAFAAVA
jgi:hypothetical protein